MSLQVFVIIFQTRNLRRSTLSHAIQMRQLMADTIVKIGALAASFCQHDPDSVCYVLSNYVQNLHFLINSNK